MFYIFNTNIHNKLIVLWAWPILQLHISLQFIKITFGYHIQRSGMALPVYLLESISKVYLFHIILELRKGGVL